MVSSSDLVGGVEVKSGFTLRQENVGLTQHVCSNAKCLQETFLWLLWLLELAQQPQPVQSQHSPIYAHVIGQ